MDLIKVCPACGNVNRATSFICGFCGTDISDVIAQKAEERKCPNCGTPLALEDIVCPTCQRTPETQEKQTFFPLILTTENGFRIVIDQDKPVILGREGDVHPEFFLQFPTVSRKHLTLRFVQDHWEGEDHSLNGTYLNGRLMPRNTPFVLREGDTLQLAHAVSFRISMGGGKKE